MPAASALPAGVPLSTGGSVLAGEPPPAGVAQAFEPAALAVIVPAHNEEELLGDCLRAIVAAASATDLPTLLVVVLDRCSDGSAGVAAQIAAEARAGSAIRILEGVFPHVGAVRNAGVSAAAAHWPGIPAQRIWTAHTDADSRVPRHWLARQAEFARAGYDLVVGTVEPDEDRTTPAGSLWFARHELCEGHSAVHGANLGMRLNRLLEAGGFSALPVSEDVETVRRLQRAGVPWIATDTTRVLTSARRAGRAPGGFARFMRDLDGMAASS